MPRDFEFPVFNFKGDLWAPRRIDAVAALADRRAAGRATAVARLAPGVSYAQAQAELDTIMRQLESEHPQTNRSVGARVMPMKSLGDEQARPAMLIVVATVAIVLLLACANVANLLLTRGAARHRELAVRAALGASRRRIVRQLLVENLLLASGGAVAGTALALAALEALRASLPELVLSTVPNIGTLGIDRTTLGFTLVLSLVTSLIFGAVPALRGSRLFLQDGLKESASAGGSAGSRRLRNALVVAEVALATTLLAGAGLLVRSYRNLEHVSPGFNPHGVVTMTTTLPQYRYGDAGRVRQFFEDALGRVEQVPSVEQAAFVNALPFSTYDRGSRFLIDGAPQPEPGREPAAGYRSITPGYFATLEMPIVTGRAFDAADREGAQPVAIVNQEFARRYLASGAPLGRRLRIAGDGTPWMTVVGVVADVQHSQLTSRPDPELYVPFAQAPLPMMMLAARVSGEPASSISAVRSAIQSVDASQPVYHVKTLDTLVSDSIGPQTMAASLVTLFSVLALALAAVGIYSVVAHAVSHHTKEFGVRMALGATQGSVVRLVLGRGLLLVGAGVVVGVCCAAAVTRLMAGALYGVTAIDPLTYGTVVGLLGVVGLCACGIPAWRATRVEPVAALRAE